MQFASMTTTADPFLDEALAAMPHCLVHCRCADRWHLVWAGLKAIGLLRGAHAQRAFLCEQLAPYRRPELRALIAGAADGASLDTLHQALLRPGLSGIGSSADITVADHCPAPLLLARERAATLGIAVQTRLGSIDTLPATAPWDLVFVHYTLSFLDAPARARFVQRLQADLAPGGLLVLAARDRAPGGNTSTDGGDAVDAWVASIEHQLRDRFAAHPQLLAPLLEALPRYARTRRLREDTMARQHELLAEFAAGGFELIEAHRNPGEPSKASNLSPPGSVTPWISFLRRGG